MQVAFFTAVRGYTKRPTIMMDYLPNGEDTHCILQLSQPAATDEKPVLG